MNVAKHKRMSLWKVSPPMILSADQLYNTNCNAIGIEMVVEPKALRVDGPAFRSSEGNPGILLGS